jgi:hypothetical protein
VRRIKKTRSEAGAYQAKQKEKQNEIIKMPGIDSSVRGAPAAKLPAEKVTQQHERWVPLDMERLKEDGVHCEKRKPWPSEERPRIRHNAAVVFRALVVGVAVATRVIRFRCE